MRILLDENLDPELAAHLIGHEVVTVAEMGWRSVQNGELLDRARLQFDAFLTLDRGLAFQHNHAGHRLIVGVLRVRNNRIETLLGVMPKLVDFLSNAAPGAVSEIDGRYPSDG